MKKLYLYMILHGNLGFSSIPKNQYSKVLDQCYWPMLEVIEKCGPIGIEFPGETLLEIEKMDPSFIFKIKDLCNQNKCEFIGSGYRQIIMPLIPYEVNQKNLELGLDIYQHFFGFTPNLFFIPEQTFSKHLPSLIQSYGYKGFIMDWDNASEYNHFSQEVRYQPALIKTESSELPVIWNSSMNSFKFQRYIYGRLSLYDYAKGIQDHYSSKNNRALCIYGTDWEIFNFRPLTHEIAFQEIERIKMIFQAIEKVPKINFCLPSDILQIIPPHTTVEIASTEIPIPCKNRDDYNVVRWAVSGRDNVLQNSKCYELYSRIKKISYFNKDINEEWKSLIHLWGSDYRTKTTSEKYYEFWNLMGESISLMKKNEEQAIKNIPNLASSGSFEVFIYNHSPYDYYQEIMEMNLVFKPGQFYSSVGILLDGEKKSSQCEEIEFYQDGSIRKLLLVFLVDIKANEWKKGKLIPVDSISPGIHTVHLNGPEITINTPHVSFALNRNTGADIRALTFPYIHNKPLIKYLPPVYFDSIAYSNDYYSAWTLLGLEGGELHRDTVLSEFQPDPGMFSIRVPVYFKHPFYNGFIQKKYNVYFNRNRVDLSQHFYFPDISPVFLRTAITTFNPEAFSIETLAFSSVNGGKHIETYPLKGKTVQHNVFPSHLCSAKGCIGDTEGWIAVHDSSSGVAMITNKSKLYSVSMVEFEEVKQKCLCRVYHSLAETDDTGKLNLRGHNEHDITYIGFKDISEVRKFAYLKNNPLFYYQVK